MRKNALMHRVDRVLGQICRQTPNLPIGSLSSWVWARAARGKERDDANELKRTRYQSWIRMHSYVLVCGAQLINLFNGFATFDISLN